MPDRIRFSINGLRGYCQPDIEQEITDLYRTHYWLYEYFISRTSAELIRGRRPLVTGELGTRRIIVKRLYHGGLLAPVTGDRFLSCHRLLAALEAEDFLHKHGVATITTEFAAWRRVRGFIRCEVGVRWLESGRDAADLLFPDTGMEAGEWLSRAESLGRMVRQLHDNEFIHPDLNLMNFYFTQAENVVILDLDKAKEPVGIAGESNKERNLMRLIRSIRKQGTDFPATYVNAVVQAVEGSYRRSDG